MKELPSAAAPAETLGGLFEYFHSSLTPDRKYNRPVSGMLRDVRETVVPDTITLSEDGKILTFTSSTKITGGTRMSEVVFDLEKNRTLLRVWTNTGFGGVAVPSMRFDYKGNPLDFLKGFVTAKNGQIYAGITSKDFLSKLNEARSQGENGQLQDPLNTGYLPIGFVSEEEAKLIAQETAIMPQPLSISFPSTVLLGAI